MGIFGSKSVCGEVNQNKELNNLYDNSRVVLIFNALRNKNINFFETITHQDLELEYLDIDILHWIIIASCFYTSKDYALLIQKICSHLFQYEYKEKNSAAQVRFKINNNTCTMIVNFLDEKSYIRDMYLHIKNINPYNVCTYITNNINIHNTIFSFRGMTYEQQEKYRQMVKANIKSFEETYRFNVSPPTYSLNDSYSPHESRIYLQPSAPILLHDPLLASEPFA